MKSPEEIAKALHLCYNPPSSCDDCPYCDIGDCTACVAKDAEACIRSLVDKVPRWISVEERLPELFTNVLVIVKCKSNSEIQGIKISSRYTPIGCYHTEWRWGCSYNEEVTHWMPLPEPPKEGHND